MVEQHNSKWLIFEDNTKSSEVNKVKLPITSPMESEPELAMLFFGPIIKINFVKLLKFDKPCIIPSFPMLVPSKTKPT